MRFERAVRWWTADDVAARMRRLAALLGPADPGINGDQVAAWEHGGSVPPARLALWCTVLDVSICDVLALLDVQQLPEWCVLAAHLNGRIGSAEMRRRDFLQLAAGGALASYQPALLAGVLARIGRPDRELVRELAVYGRHLAGQTGTMPPALLRAAVLQHLETVKALLGGPLSPGLRVDLMGVGGHAAALAGQVCRFLGRDDEARNHLSLAGHLASSAGDTGLQALALVWTADTLSGVQRAAAPVDDHRQVLALLDRAENQVLRSAPPSVAEYTFLRLAEEHAAAGDVAEAARYVERADAVLDVAQTMDPGLYGIGWGGAVAHDCFRGSVELLSGRPQQAAAVLGMLLDHMPAAYVSARSAVMADLAAAHARLGDLDESASLLIGAWEIADGADLDDRRRRVLGVRHRDLGQWAGEPAMQRLDERIGVADRVN